MAVERAASEKANSEALGMYLNSICMKNVVSYDCAILYLFVFVAQNYIGYRFIILALAKTQLSEGATELKASIQVRF